MDKEVALDKVPQTDTSEAQKASHKTVQSLESNHASSSSSDNTSDMDCDAEGETDVASSTLPEIQKANNGMYLFVNFPPCPLGHQLMHFAYIRPTGNPYSYKYPITTPKWNHQVDRPGCLQRKSHKGAGFHCHGTGEVGTTTSPFSDAPTDWKLFGSRAHA